MPLRGPCEPGVRPQPRLALRGPFPADQAQRGGADEGEVAGGRCDVRIYAGIAVDRTGAGRRSVLEGMVAPPRGSGVAEPSGMPARAVSRAGMPLEAARAMTGAASVAPNRAKSGAPRACMRAT